MAANNNRYNRRSDQTAYQSHYNQPQMRSQMGAPGPAGPQMQAMHPYQFGQIPPHGFSPFQQLAHNQMAAAQYMPDQRTFVQPYQIQGSMQFGGVPPAMQHQGYAFSPQHGGPAVYVQPHMMGQQQTQPSPHQQMAQHSAHSSPTPPMQHQQQQQQQQHHQQQQQQTQQPPPQPPPQQQQQQLPPQQTSHLPKPKSKGIKIVDPSTNQEVDMKVLAKQPAAPSSEHSDTLQNKERRDAFKEQVYLSARNRPTEQSQAKSAPHTSPAPSPAHSPAPKIEHRPPPAHSPAPKIEHRAPVEIKKSPATKPPPQSEPVKTAAPVISILPRSNSQSEEKTPEKQGIEISVQTTPSLKKSGRISPAPGSHIPAPPKFDSPPKFEAAPKPECPPKKVETKSEKLDEPVKKKEFDNINSIGDKKLDGETIIIDNSTRKEVVKEETKKEALKPAEEVKAKMTEEVKSEPTEDVKVKEMRPSEEMKAKPAEEVTSKPTEESEAKQTKELEVKPTEDMTKPAEEVEAKPTEEMKPKPTEEVNVKPTEEVKPTLAEKVNGVVEKVVEKLTIEIPNGQEEVIQQDDVPSSEESSECKDQFETPPATPSEVREPEPPATTSEVREPEPPATPSEPEPSVTPSEVLEPEVPPPPVVEEKHETKAAEKIEKRKPAEETEKRKPAEETEKTEKTEDITETENLAPVNVGPEKELEEGEIAAEEEVEEEKTGPFRYTRDEMVALREAQDKPLAGIPKFDCIMDKPILKVEPIRPRPNNQFVPAWEQSGSRNRSRGGGDRNRSMDKNHSSMSMKPRIIEHTLAPVVTRKKSSNAWLSKREDTAPKEKVAEVSDQRLRGNIVAILNKITPQNFKELSVQILQLHIDNKEKLELAVEIIFEKAVLEPAFSQTYANLCKIMGSIKFPEEQNPKVSPFRKTLLNRCQKEFFREKSDEDILTKKMEDLAARTDLSESERQAQTEEIHYQKSKLKKKMLGNINFIGELFNLGMLSSKIILSQCIGNLISKKEKGKLDDEVIECLAKLFSTVGLKLETECDDEMKKRAFEESFGSFKAFATDVNYPYRIRFMIQDVVDLRENKWVPRRLEAKPQRIEDIHREHAREEQEKKMEAAVLRDTSRTKSKSRADSRDERGRGSRDGREKHDFTPAPKRVNTNIDMSKISGANQKCIPQKLDSSAIVLGPSRAQWGRGSGTGSGANSPLSGSKEDLSTTTANRFDMLSKTKLVPGRTSSAPATRKMMERERASAVAHAQSIARPGRRTPSQSPVRSAPQKEDPLSDEEIKKKTKSILAEYFDIEEIEEACACIKEELQLVKKHNIFVQQAIDMVMEAKPKSLKLLGVLLPALFEENPPLMTADGLLTGFQPAFEVAQDLAIDVPAVYANFGKLLGHTFAKGHLTFRVIKGALGPLKESDKAGLVMCEVIKSALDVLGTKGRMEIQQKWGKDKMSWSELCNNPADLIERYKLDFLSTTSEPKESVSETNIDISLKLRNILQDETKSKEDVFNYIDQSVPKKSQKEGQFIKDLMKVACQFCVNADPHSVGNYTISEENFLKLSPILMKYLQSHKDNQEVELHALDAVQLLVHEMSHPRDLASNLFCKLEDDDIITEQGFRHWRENGKEQQGHGVMRQNLKNFFEDLSQDSADDSDTNSEHVK